MTESESAVLSTVYYGAFTVTRLLAGIDAFATCVLSFVASVYLIVFTTTEKIKSTTAVCGGGVCVCGWVGGVGGHNACA
jgi:hypothetical protein